MKVLILGGSGFIGQALAAALGRRGDEVSVTSLRDPVAAANAAAQCDAVINLSGEPIAQRWNDIVKQRIVYSRSELPRRFVVALGELEPRTSVYISASGIGYYGISESETFDESSLPGDDFLARVCVAWEGPAVDAASALGLRTAVVRTGIVLAANGGALAKMLPPFRLGLGGVIGSGQQWYSWVHLEDAVAIYIAALERGTGAYNATAPDPVTNAQFTLALGKALHRPTIFPTPTVALQLMLGEGAYAVLTGQRVLPRRTVGDLGYVFAFDRLDSAFTDILGG